MKTHYVNVQTVYMTFVTVMMTKNVYATLNQEAVVVTESFI